MFAIPMTLQNILELRDPSERVTADERVHYENALGLIERDGFESYQLQGNEDGLLNLQMFFTNLNGGPQVKVRMIERATRGPLGFSCSLCLNAGRLAKSCEHQWAAFILLWEALTAPDGQIRHTQLLKLSEELKGPVVQAAADEIENADFGFAGVKFESISLFLDESPLLGGATLSSQLKTSLNQYRTHEVEKEEELLSPRLWNLPEIFRRRLTAYSEHYFNEVNLQNQMADIVRYNFSNGMQISAKEILRHPLQKKIQRDLLPQAKVPGLVFNKWPLTQQSENIFISQALNELEEITQSLLAHIATLQRQKKIEVFLQTKNSQGRAMKIETIEFDPAHELFWRVEFSEKQGLESEFRLMSLQKEELSFYGSFALDTKNQTLIVHPWLRELNQLQEIRASVSKDFRFADREMPVIFSEGELEAKTILKYLRTRTIPVKITGDSQTLGADQSQTEVRLNEAGSFYLQHEARIAGQKNLVRKGWTTKAVLFLQTLSRGLPFLLNSEAREIAARIRTKREWDLKILKHLGILQYLFMETLSFHFEGTLIDGTVVTKEELFNSLHTKIQALLVAGTGEIFIREQPLTDLCSKVVLSCFEDFVLITLKALTASEAFYSEDGEVILEGVIEREFRLIFEMLKKMALVTGGEAFRRSRTPFLSRISSGDLEEDLQLTTASFHFPVSELQKISSLHHSLESLQPLIPSGFKIFFKDQALQELDEDEFRVDFVLESDTNGKFFNWFELNPKFFLRGQEIDPGSLGSLGGGGVIEYDGKIYLVPQKQMPSLRRLESFWQKLQKGKIETGKKKNGENVYQLPRNQTLELLALRSSGVEIRGDSEWKKLCDFYDKMGTQSRDLILPKSMKGELKPYQALGVQWLQDLYQLRLGALLADDMGLGKTLQTLAFLDDLRSKNELGQVLIVVPSSLIFNWQQEVEKFTPELPLTVFSSRDSDKVGKRLASQEEMVVITTYGLLMEHEDFLNQYKWKVVIFDEAQNLKNISAKRTSAARSLTAQFKICLTGTPMENHYGEFYSLVDLLVPGSLGRVDEFRGQFVNTENVSREQIDSLKLKIRPLLMRRTKKEILDQLPEKQETKISIAFEERQKEIYRDIALSYNQRVQETIVGQGEASVQLQMLTAILRLRQACSDPAALPNVRYDKVPPKLETLLDSLKEIVESGESALVFTQFLQTLEHTAKILREANIPVFVLHGGIPTKQRQKILSDFGQEKGGAVLVMTLKTGGVGLNLTKASYVFHIEPWWNPSVENQATDRAHRLGQSKAVQVFRYIMHESLEEKIELLKDRKDRKFQSLFATTERDVEIGQGSGALSKEDFDLLLGIKQ